MNSAQSLFKAGTDPSSGKTPSHGDSAHSLTPIRRPRRRLEGFRPNPALRLLDQCREVLRFHHFSYRTEQTYLDWIRRFILFHDKRHPREIGKLEINRFLSHLAVAGKVAASTQNQALHALLFLYQDVLGTDLGCLDDFARAKRPARLPEVLSRDEVKAVLLKMPVPYSLLAGLLYGAGLRLTEGLRLRVKDVDFHRGQIIVHDGKGAKDRVTVLPQTLTGRLRSHLAEVNRLWEIDRSVKVPGVWVPDALGRKYPKAGEEWIWQWVFPSTELSLDPRSGLRRRHHLSDGRAAGSSGRIASCQDRALGDAAYVSPFIRHPPTGVGDGYTNAPRTPGESGCFDDADLHSCDAKARNRRVESVGP